MCVFKEELDLISDSTVRDFTNQVLNFVHLCDYLASRKFLEFNFEV